LAVNRAQVFAVQCAGTSTGRTGTCPHPAPTPDGWVSRWPRWRPAGAVDQVLGGAGWAVSGGGALRGAHSSGGQRQPAGGFGRADEVGEGGQHLGVPALGLGRSAGRRPARPVGSRGELVDDVAGVGDGAGEPVELGDHKGVAGPAGGEGLAQAGALAVGAGDAVVDVDPVGLHAEGGKGLALRGQVLPIGADPGVADLDRGHGRSRAGCPTLTGHLRGRVVRERR